MDKKLKLHAMGIFIVHTVFVFTIVKTLGNDLIYSRFRMYTNKTRSGLSTRHAADLSHTIVINLWYM